MNHQPKQLDLTRRAVRCSDDATLAAFDNGQLDPGPAEVVILHLERCERCRVRLDELSRAGDQLTLFLREGGHTIRPDFEPLPTSDMPKAGRRGFRRWWLVAGGGVVAGATALAVFVGGSPNDSKPAASPTAVGTRPLPPTEPAQAVSWGPGVSLNATNLIGGAFFPKGEPKHARVAEIPVSDPVVPFDRALRVDVTVPFPTDGDVGVSWPNRVRLAKRERLLARVWLREPDRGSEITTYTSVFADPTGTSRPVLLGRISLTRKWVRHEIAFQPAEGHAENALRFRFDLCTKCCALEIGGFEVVRPELE